MPHDDAIACLEIDEEFFSPGPVGRSARCGRYRRHGEGCEDALQPGAHVNTATGDAISVRRVAEANAYSVAQVDQTGRELARSDCEQHFVRAGDIEVLGSPVR